MADRRKPGNINLWSRPRVTNPDGSVSTVSSMGISADGKEVLIPQVIPDKSGKYYTDTKGDAARQRYHQTGEHLGEFDSVADSNAYAEQLHRDYEEGKFDVPLASSRRETDPNALAQALTRLLQRGWF